MQYKDAVHGKYIRVKKYLKLEVSKGSAGPSVTILSKVETYYKLYRFLVRGPDNHLPPQKGSLKKALKTKKLWPF